MQISMLFGICTFVLKTGHLIIPSTIWYERDQVCLNSGHMFMLEQA